MKTIIETKHVSVDIDKDFIVVNISFSLHFRLVYIQLLNIIIRFY